MNREFSCIYIVILAGTCTFFSFGWHLLDPTTLLVLSNLLDATASNNLNASRLIRVKFCYHATCLMLLYPTTMVVGSNMLNFASSGTCYETNNINPCIWFKNKNDHIVFPVFSSKKITPIC